MIPLAGPGRSPGGVQGLRPSIALSGRRNIFSLSSPCHFTPAILLFAPLIIPFAPEPLSE